LIANVFCFGAFADKISGVMYNNLTGNFPFMSIDGSVCFFVMYHYKTNAIFVKAITNLDDQSIYEAYKEAFETLEAKGYKPKMNVMDNQVMKCIGKKIQLKKNATYKWSNCTTTGLMLQNKPSRHLKMPSSRSWQQQIVSFHYNCGTKWHCRCKTH
jgi:hypothetical protein